MAATASSTKHWSGTGKLRGGVGSLRFFMGALRLLGLRVTYLLLIPPVIFFSFVSPDVPATMDFHRRVFGPRGFLRRRWLLLKHFFSFGRAIIDRTAILAGMTKRFTFAFDGEQHLRDAVAGGKGVLLLTAHVGNWEVAGQLLSRIDVPVNVTGFDNEDPAVRELLNKFSKQKFKLIPLTGAPTDVIELVAALRRGELVAMLGDRAYGGPTARVPFLGDHASFPVGPYVLSAIAGAPLVQVFSLREPGGHYHFFGFPAVPPYHPPRHERDAHLRRCVVQFAANLESIVKRDPLQWYNFFPFWDEPAARDKVEAAATGMIPSVAVQPSSAARAN